MDRGFSSGKGLVKSVGGQEPESRKGGWAVRHLLLTIFAKIDCSSVVWVIGVSMEPRSLLEENPLGPDIRQVGATPCRVV